MGESVRPPLRWAGSKRAQVGLLARFLPSRYRAYIEPFAGSACLFFHLTPPRAILGDRNADLIGFYHALARSPHRLLAELSKYDASGDDYYILRSQEFPSKSIRRAAQFLYLNRFCFNGVYRTNRIGRFNVPRGHHTGRLPTADDLFVASRVLANACQYAADFEDTVALAERGDFVYLDPPYARRRSLRPGEYGYQSLDGDSDLCRLACTLDELDRKGVWYLASYMNSSHAVRLIPHRGMRRITVRRNVGGFAATRRLTTELLLANYPI